MATTRIVPRGTGLLAKTLLLFGLMALALIVLIVVMLRSVSTAQDAAAAHETADLTLNAVNHLGQELRLVANAERDAIMSGSDASLSTHVRAERHLPEHVLELDALALGPSLEPARTALTSGVSSYVEEWLAPLVAESRDDPAAALASMRSGTGQLRVIQLEVRIEEYRQAHAAFTASLSENVEAATGEAVRLAYVVMGAVLLALAGSVAATYFQVTRPVGDLVRTTTRFAAGDMAARAAETGLPELKLLGAVFNEMAGAIETSRDALAQQSAELRAVLDAATDGILVSDLDGQIVFTNAAADTTWPADLRTAEGGPIKDFIDRLASMTTVPDRWAATARRLAANPTAEVTSEFTLEHSRQTFVSYTGPVMAADGTPIGRIYVGRDITAERNAERAKEQFVATVSHELRTPLTSIIGYLELALEDSAMLDEQLVKFLTVAQRNADRLLEMVGDLLIVSQIESDSLTFDMERMDLGLIVTDAVEAVRPLADKKEQLLDLTHESGVWIVGDPLRLSDMVGNLLSNAVKFTPQGGRVDVRLDRQNGDAHIEVSDSGIGISRTDQDHLFERFFRAQTARDSAIPGTGLGLAICKAIAEGHGGGISVASTVGQGTRFVVELPTTGNRGPR